MVDNSEGVKKRRIKLYENDYLRVYGIEIMIYQKLCKSTTGTYPILSLDDKHYFGLNVDENYQLLKRKFKIKFVDSKNNSYDIEEFTNFSLKEKNKEICYLYLVGNKYNNFIVIDQAEVKNTNGDTVFNALGLSNKELEEIKQAVHFKTSTYLNSAASSQYSIDYDDPQIMENFNERYNYYYEKFFSIILAEYATSNKDDLGQTYTIPEFQKRLILNNK